MTAPYLPIFQVNIPVRMSQAALTTSVVTLYTTPSNVRTNMQDIIIANTTGGALTCNLFVVPSTNTAGTANAILYGFSIGANTSYHWTGTQILFSGDTIQAQASATGLTISISGQQAT